MSLIELIDNSKTDKNTIHSYLDTYENLFNKKKLEKINLLEVGIYNGGSIKLWSNYFINGTIYGIDITSINEIFSENVKIFQNTDAYDQSFVDSYFKSTNFDILIDDGPHTFDTVVKFIELYLPLLSKNGIFIIEDIQDWSWIDNLIQIVPDHYKQYIKVADLRNIKNRYDDILFIIDLSDNI
jgi:cephalosporin hydroxylase